MRSSSWKDWFGAEVGFSIYIHRRGFTSSSTNSNQPSLLPLPRRVSAATGAPARLGSSHQHAGQAPPYRSHKAKFAPCETPPGRVGLVLKLDSLYIYIGGVSHHHAPSIINHQSVLPASQGARARRAARAHARYAYAPCAHAPCAHAPYAYAPYAYAPYAYAPYARAPYARAPYARAPYARAPRSRALSQRARRPRARSPRVSGLRTHTLGNPTIPVSFTPLSRGLSP